MIFKENELNYGLLNDSLFFAFAMVSLQFSQLKCFTSYPV